MLINGTSIEQYQAYLLGTPKISPAPITPNILTYKNGSNFITIGRTVGLKKIECYIAFIGETYYINQYDRSLFRAELLNTVDIDFETDEFKYYCAYETDAELESESENVVVSKFTFTGIQHDDLSTRTGSNFVVCTSTVPETDCRISATARNYASSCVIAGVNFGSRATGVTLIVDGINKRILARTTSGEERDVYADFVKFPTLKPGINTLDIDTSVLSNIKVEYYPTFL